MRIALFLAAAVTLGAGLPLASMAANAPAKIMIVGVSHLVARRDVHNSVFTDSPLSPKRQAQIDDIVTRLAQFHPTKVLIERDYGDPKPNALYQQYLAGTYALSANEAEQFGYKLAKRSGDKAIHPIDADGPQLIDENSAKDKPMVEYLEKNMGSASTPAFSAFLKRNEYIELHGTYLDLLRYLNTDEAIRANASSYSVIDGMGKSVNNAGATYVSMWYGRNAFIFSNILATVQPGDRVVVLIGQGHEYLLREFARLNPRLEVVDALTYLHR